MNIHLSHQFGLLSVKGVDATKFLQGQLTCDINSLDARGGRGAFCTPKGRVYASFYIAPNDDGFLLRMNTDIINECITRLKKYAVFFKVELVDSSADYHVIFATNSTLNNNTFANSFIHAALHDEHPYLNEIWLPSSTDVDDILGNASQQDSDWLNLQLIRCGLFDINSGNIEQWLPHNLGLQHENNFGNDAISYTKGCYTGQEIVARTHYLGKVKKTLHYLNSEQEKEVSTKEIGTVVLTNSISPFEFLYIGIEHV